MDHGPAAYLDVEQVLDAALSSGCSAVHPGYGFLSEQAAFAEACAEQGLTFVGPPPAALAALGDKAEARGSRRAVGSRSCRARPTATSVDEALAFFDSLGGGAAMIKAIAGGGGRGMRVVSDRGDLPEAFARCESEARAAFGDGRLYIEQHVSGVRHVEVQVLGDHTGQRHPLG